MKKLHILLAILVIITYFIVQQPRDLENMATLTIPQEAVTLFNNIKNVDVNNLVGYFIPENIDTATSKWINMINLPAYTTTPSVSKIADATVVTTDINLTPVTDTIIKKSYFTGTWKTKINWDNIPTTYTLFHITKYYGANKGRIFNGTFNNWISGFYNGSAGFAFHDSGLTNSQLPSNTDWVLSADQKNLYRSNGSNRTVSGYKNGSSPNGLTINNSIYGSPSDFACAIVIIFNGELSEDQIRIIETYLSDYYNIPIPLTTRLIPGQTTTAAPTTTVPRTAAPTTTVPRTAAPTTAAPTTTVPRTAAPTTTVPRTAAPTTTVPRTAAPITTGIVDKKVPCTSGGFIFKADPETGLNGYNDSTGVCNRQLCGVISGSSKNTGYCVKPDFSYRFPPNVPIIENAAKLRYIDTNGNFI